MARPRKIDQLRRVEGAETGLPGVALAPGVRVELPAPRLLADMSALFAALADPTRLQIIAVLSTRELCVGDLAEALRLSQSALSHQLRVLRDLRLVRARREGRQVYYALDDEHVTRLYDETLAHVGHSTGEDR